MFSSCFFFDKEKLKSSEGAKEEDAEGKKVGQLTNWPSVYLNLDILIVCTMKGARETTTYG